MSEYQQIQPEAVVASKALSEAYEKLGKPQDPFSKSGEQMLRLIIAAWEDLYPKQVKEWTDMRDEYREAEKAPEEQAIGKTGRSLASIPTPIYTMMKRVFPQFKLDSRENFIKLVKKYPVFRMTRKV